MTYLTHIWAMASDAAPWLLFGLIAAAVVKAFVPASWVARQLGSHGPASVLRGSLIGIPLPLCSCGVLPTALALRKQGAGKPATVSFLVATPEIGLDSFALSFALLGPFMAVVRPVAALVSALVAGFVAMFVERRDTTAAKPQAPGSKERSPDLKARIVESLRYVFTTLWDDVKIWLGVAIVVAGLAMAFTDGQPATFLQQWGSGWPAMGVMLLVGIPLYICATASTPIAAALLIAGVSPGTVLVLLLAGPATNLGAIAVLKKELGTPVLIAYLLSIAAMSMAAGLATDAVVAHWHINVVAQAAQSAELLPGWLGAACAIVLIALSIKPLRRLIGTSPKKSCGCGCASKHADQAAGH